MESNRQTRIAVLGAGLIGERHAGHVWRQAILHAVVDPDPAARALAERFSSPWLPDLDTLLAENRPDGVIVATPTRLHVQNALACVACGVPVLIEKPIADTLADGQRLVEVAARAGVPLLVGHHRRYNPIMRKAREIVDSGRLGKLVSVHAQFWLYKPDDYFDIAWRRRKGGGPVLTNLIHDIDLMRYLCGDVASVQALESNAARGLEVEDSAAILLQFANGVLGTVTVSDSIVAPWSWELTSGENPAYPRTGQSCYMIGGTRGSLSLPDLGVWTNASSPSWWQPIARESQISDNDDPLALQVRHFCDVIDGTAEPHMSGAEALKSLAVIDAIKRAAASGSRIELGAEDQAV